MGTGGAPSKPGADPGGGRRGGPTRSLRGRRARGSLTRLLIFLALTCSGPCLPGVSRGEVGEAPRISSIRFEGNHRLKAGQLQNEMRLRPPRWWNPFSRPRYTGADFLASDLRTILARYTREGFPLARILDAVVAYNDAGNAVNIRIQIEEGPQVRLRSFQIRGVHAAFVAELNRYTLLKPGSALSWPRVLAERNRIQSYFANRGFAMVRAGVEVRYQGAEAEAIYTVETGQRIRVGRITVEGAEHSRPSMVRREIVLKSGDWLQTDRVLRSQERLLGSGVFVRARIVPSFPDSTKPVADLTVNVAERKHGWYGLGAGYSSADRLRFAGDWGLNNIAGMGRRLSLSGNIYYSLDPNFRGGGLQFREGQVQTEYTEPWLAGTRTRGIISPYVAWLQEETFHQRTLGNTATLRRDLTLFSRVSLSLETKRVSTTDTTVTSRLYTTNLANLSYTEDRRNNVFNPSTGRLVQGSTEYAGGLLQGTNEFGRFVVSWQGYTSPQRGWVFAARFKAGQITPIGRGLVSAISADTLRLSRIPWDERFRLGGGNSVRGYPESKLGRLDSRGAAIGGLSLLLANLEIRFPLVWIVQGGLFLDAGNVWTDPRELTWGRLVDGPNARAYDPKNLAYGMGLGIRFMTPVGPFRVDYGFKVAQARAPGEGPAQLHVALGQAF